MCVCMCTSYDKYYITYILLVIYLPYLYTKYLSYTHKYIILHTSTNTPHIDSYTPIYYTPIYYTPYSTHIYYRTQKA